MMPNFNTRRVIDCSESYSLLGNTQWQAFAVRSKNKAVPEIQSYYSGIYHFDGVTPGSCTWAFESHDRAGLILHLRRDGTKARNVGRVPAASTSRMRTKHAGDDQKRHRGGDPDSAV